MTGRYIGAVGERMVVGLFSTLTQRWASHIVHADHRSGETRRIAGGQTSNATQQSKHFQSFGYVLCGTVNSKAMDTALETPGALILNAPAAGFCPLAD